MNSQNFALASSSLERLKTIRMHSSHEYLSPSCRSPPGVLFHNLKQPTATNQKDLNTELWLRQINLPFQSSNDTNSLISQISRISSMSDVESLMSVNSNQSFFSTYKDLANTSTSDMNSNSPHLRNMNNSNNVPPHQNSSTCLPQLPLIHYFDESVNFLLSHDKAVRMKSVEMIKLVFKKFDKHNLNAVDTNKIVNLMKQLLKILDNSSLDELKGLLECLHKILKCNFKFSDQQLQQLIVASPSVASNFVKLLLKARNNDFQHERHQILLIIYHFIMNYPKLVSKSLLDASNLLNLLSLLGQEQGPSKNLLNQNKHLILLLITYIIKGSKHLRQCLLENNGMINIISNVSSKNSKKIRKQSLRCLIVLLDCQDINFATEFVRIGGIDVVANNALYYYMEAELQPNDKDLDDDILVNSLMCLSLVGHLPSIQSLELSNLSNSIQLAINSIISNRRPNFSKYFKNLQCSIYFISNVLALNSFVKEIITKMERGIEYLVSLAKQCFDALSDPEKIKILVSGSNETEEKVLEVVREILQRSLVAISAVNKEDNAHFMDASKKLATNNVAIELFSHSLFNKNIGSNEKIVMLRCLKRIISCYGSMILPETEWSIFSDQDLLLVKTLCKFISIEDSNLATNKTHEQVQDLCLAIQILSDLAKKSCSISNKFSDLIKQGWFRPFEILNNVTNDEFFINLLQLLRELCQQDVGLQTLWQMDKSVALFLQKCNRSCNKEIAQLCDKLRGLINFEIEEYGLFDSYMDFS